MKKTLTILSAIFILSACKKDAPIQPEVDASKNPQLISVSVDNTTSKIVVVR